MIRVRLFLAWLLLAALPLQGLAAASMALCQQGHDAVASAPAAGHHGAAHDHDGAAAADSHDHQDQANDADADHRCMVCGTACHAVAIASEPVHWLPAPAPRAPLDEAFVRIASRPAPVPDKPPRA